MKKLYLIPLLILLLIFGLASPAWAPVSHRSIEDETSYASMRGSFVDDQAWFDGLIPTALTNNVTGITKANPGVVSSVAHGLNVGDLAYFDSLNEMTELNSKTVTVTVLDSANTFSINNTSGYGAAETTGGACGHSVVSLEDYASTGNKLIVYDGAGAEYAEGYIGAAGTGETLAAELLNGGDFEAGGTGGDFNGGAEIDDGTSDTFDPAIGAAWVNGNVNDGNGDKVEATATKYAGNYAVKITKTLAAHVRIASPLGEVTVESGKLYEYSFWTRGDGAIAGTYGLYDRTNAAYIIGAATSTGVTGAVYTLVEKYFTAPVDCVTVDITFRVYAAGTAYFDSASIKEVTEPNASACHIYKEHGLTTEGWADIDVGIDYNAGTSWDFDVYPYRSKGGSRLGMGSGGFCPYVEAD